jgi:hypothetical protein
MKPVTNMKHWRCRLGFLAWLLTVATAVFSAALTLLLAEAVLERLVAAGGLWGVVPFGAAVTVMVVGVFALLRSGFGLGTLWGRLFGIPPTWLSAALAILLFLGALWFTGPAPHPTVPSDIASGLQRVEAIFTHGWVWLWGAV